MNFLFYVASGSPCQLRTWRLEFVSWKTGSRTRVWKSVGCTTLDRLSCVHLKANLLYDKQKYSEMRRSINVTVCRPRFFVIRSTDNMFQYVKKRVNEVKPAKVNRLSLNCLEQYSNGAIHRCLCLHCYRSIRREFICWYHVHMKKNGLAGPLQILICEDWTCSETKIFTCWFETCYQLSVKRGLFPCKKQTILGDI